MQNVLRQRLRQGKRFHHTQLSETYLGRRVLLTCRSPPPLAMTLNLPVSRKTRRRPEKASILSHFLYSIDFWENGKLCCGLRL